MRNNLNITVHHRSIFNANILHFVIFYNSVTTDKYINMSISKDIHALKSFGTPFNPVFVKIKRDAESQMGFVRTSVLLLF